MDHPAYLATSLSGMSTRAVWSDYLPYRGLSAWFSSSVKPAVSKKWGKAYADLCGHTTMSTNYLIIIMWFIPALRPRHADQYGGSFSGETEADFLFSDNTFSADTVRYVCVYMCAII